MCRNSTSAGSPIEPTPKRMGCGGPDHRLSLGREVSLLRLPLCVALVAFCFGSSAGATSYRSLTLNELIMQADVIFVGEVVDVRPFVWPTRDATLVGTRVTFRVWDPIFGTTSVLEAFDFLGGELDGVAVTVAGMPKFAKGDRRVVFASRKPSINPIIGFTQGLLRIQSDAQGVAGVYSLEGPHRWALDRVGIAAGKTSPRAPLRLSEFRNHVVRQLVEGGRR